MTRLKGVLRYMVGFQRLDRLIVKGGRESSTTPTGFATTNGSSNLCPNTAVKNTRRLYEGSQRSRRETHRSVFSSQSDQSPELDVF